MTRTDTSSPPHAANVPPETSALAAALDNPPGAGYAIGQIQVKDPDKWRDYCSRVPATLAPWNGQVMMRGSRLTVFHGEHGSTLAVVLRFPDAASVTAWHDSPAYQALIPLRNEAADVVLVAYAS